MHDDYVVIIYGSIPHHFFNTNCKIIKEFFLYYIVMELETIGLFLGILLNFVSLIIIVIKISMDYQKLKTEKNTLEKEIQEVKENIKELFESRNRNEGVIIKLSTILENLSSQMAGIDKKIDELKNDLIKGR